MQARHTIYVKRWTDDGTEDAWGNVTSGFSDPEPVKVFSIAPSFSNEKEFMVATGNVIASPSDYGITAKDVVLFDLDGPEYQVQGDVIDCNRGPWGYRPGFIINVQKADR